MEQFTKEQLIARIETQKEVALQHPECSIARMDLRLAEIALEALTAQDAVDAGEHFQRGYDEGHSRGLTCGKLYKTDGQMRQHRAACALAYRAEINGGETD